MSRAKEATSRWTPFSASATSATETSVTSWPLSSTSVTVSARISVPTAVFGSAAGAWTASRIATANADITAS